jgi:hypothetical protein
MFHFDTACEMKDDSVFVGNEWATYPGGLVCQQVILERTMKLLRHKFHPHLIMQSENHAQKQNIGYAYEN